MINKRKTDEEKSQIEAYENEHDITDDTSRDEHINKGVDIPDNNTPASTHDIDDLHEQDTKELEDKLDKKEKSAKYQEDKKKKKDEEEPAEEKSSNNGLLTLCNALCCFLVAAWFFLIKNNLLARLLYAPSEKRRASTENRTESREQKTEQRAEETKVSLNG